ncbi:hypothetical protein HPB51_020767 [Rhipicephalus microplus]|uniref:Uncharacterized protein n=1 Tax=Rhipicephalus microplus TaxID=6941 RepID=A0A9J6DQ13_RHIMP|nr:hypothetical protein HPB51_020767 [Rhipicephalus microplus]
MSSYQFVNSLASCYGQQRGQDTDYYTPQVQPYAATGCYSGPASPVQPYGGPYSQPAAHLQNGGEHGFPGCGQRLPGGHPSPRTPTPSAASCKYATAESTAASPQDLSASSTQSPSSPETRGSSPSDARRAGCAQQSAEERRRGTAGQRRQLAVNRSNKRSSSSLRSSRSPLTPPTHRRSTPGCGKSTSARVSRCHAHRAPSSKHTARAKTTRRRCRCSPRDARKYRAGLLPSRLSPGGPRLVILSAPWPRGASRVAPVGELLEAAP